MEDTFLSHYVCAECVDKNRCEYWSEAFDCYWEGEYNKTELLEEFRRNCEETYRPYALAQMNEWQRRTAFTHEHGKRIRRLTQLSVRDMIILVRLYPTFLYVQYVVVFPLCRVPQLPTPSIMKRYPLPNSIDTVITTSRS